MAFGVLSFALIPMIGLLPMALNNFREVKRETVHANILQFVSSQSNLTPFTGIAALSTGAYGNASAKPWTFDDQGQVIFNGTTTTANTSPVIYKVYITVTNTSSSTALLPGYTADNTTDPYAYSTNTCLLTVQIVDTDRPARPATNTIIVANMGK